MRILLFLALLLPALAPAQTCLCCKKLEKGQTAYDQGDYSTALARWQEGLKLSDAANCPELKALVTKAKKKLAPKPTPPKPRDRDEDGTPDAQDNCPNDYGPKRFSGCPDADGDAVPDYQDNCPNTYGVKSANGCPDRDGDGVADDKDKCPEERGDPRYNGCAAPKPPEITPTPGPGNMVKVPGATYTMGDLFGDGNETQHAVTLSSFYMGKTEVTFDEFDAFCAATSREKPSDSNWGRGQRPVINVDWYDAVEYCNWLSQQAKLTPVYTIDKARQDPNNQNKDDTKKYTVAVNWAASGYRLPTEAEWEFAAREGGKKVRFGNGKDIADPAQINFDASESYKKDYSVVGEYRQKTVPVNELTGAVNSLGLRHMSGNVYEWCQDWYGSSYYSESSGATDPKGPGSGENRVVRGGCWYDRPFNCRSADRLVRRPYYRFVDVGFRVVRHL